MQRCRITGFGPIAEQRRQIEQRIAPRSHVPIDQGHRAEIRRVEDEIVELVALRLDAASCLISFTEGIRHVPAIIFWLASTGSIEWQTIRLRPK